MTLENAQRMAVSALKAAFTAMRPKVYVESYDGMLSFKEGRQRFKNTPVLLVSPLTVDDSQIQLAVYMLASSTDEGVVSVIDATVRTLRGLSGSNRIPLSVASRSLYDEQATATGLRLWVHVVTWPHLAEGTAATAVDSPVCAAKERIAALFPAGLDIVTTEAEARCRMQGETLPFVTILAGQGDFDASDRRTAIGVVQGERYSQCAKGSAVWSIEIKAYAASESEAESLIWQVIPYLPHRVQDDMSWNTTMTIAGLEEGKTENGAAVAAATVRLEVPALQRMKRIPIIRDAKVLGEED